MKFMDCKNTESKVSGRARFFDYFLIGIILSFSIFYISRNLCGVQVHDDEGIYLHTGIKDKRSGANFSIGLGHKRLTIIDLSNAGRQPLTNEDNTIWLV